jgi:GPI mannosyltransferase 3
MILTTKFQKPSFLLLVIFLIFSVAAYFMVGSLHADEHYQILEFANYKRGLVEAKQLPWEFGARLRPAIQPTMAFMVLTFFEWINLNNPFVQAFLFRLVSGGLFIYSSFRVYQVLVAEFKTPFFQYLYFIFTFFLYFFPYIGVRFSSENFSACFYMLAFASLYPVIHQRANLTYQKAFEIGILFGMSFLFRYQAALMILGLALWLLIFHFQQLRYWLLMFGGFVLMIGVGILIDRWFYGEWVMSAWHYFYVNLMEGKAASFGVEPWWWYFSMLDFKRLWLINGSLILLILCFGIIKFKHPISWIFFPFLVIHLLISHKEMRFIFPILTYIPFMSCVSIQFLSDKIKRPLLLYMGSFLFLVINIFAFVGASFNVPDNSHEIFKFIQKLPNKPIEINYMKEDLRFFYALNDGSKDITPRFYKDTHKIILKTKAFQYIDSIPVVPYSKDTLKFVVLDDWEQYNLKNRLKLAYDPESEFVRFINYHNWMHLGASRWKLYYLNPEHAQH